MRTKLLHSYTCLPARQVARLLKKKQCNNLTIYQSNRAFTLIELLIVIALIGILSSFGVFSYQSSQKKARDSQRKSDLQMVKKALEAAKNDCQTATYYPFSTLGDAAAPKNAYTNIITDLKNSKYLEIVPQDPKNDSFYFYTYSPNTSYISYSNNDCAALTLRATTKTYVLTAKLEISQDPDSAKSFNNCQSIIAFIPNTLGHTPSSGDGYYYVCND